MSKRPPAPAARRPAGASKVHELVKVAKGLYKDLLRKDGQFARQFAVFSGIGIINTLIHLAVVVVLVEAFSTHPVLANTLAFLTANVFSYWANCRWIFRAAPTSRRYPRFFIVSVSGLILTVVITSIAAALDWHYLMGTIMVIGTLPILTFVAHRTWTWSDRA